MQRAPDSQKRFSIALSFPGERRAFVSAVASHLATHVGTERVLYDQFHEAAFPHWDFDLQLQRLYRDETELIVVFLCAEYRGKEWCGVEWRVVRDLVKRGQGATVMLLRFDDTEIPGILSIDNCVWIGNNSPEQIGDRILHRHQALTATPAADLPQLGLHGAPPPPPDFVGRGETLGELTKLARQGGIRAYGITGMPGVGKSSVAQKLAEELEADFPDAQFFFDLKGDTANPAPAKTVMATIVRALNPDRRPALSEEVQQNFYLDELHGRRVLIILDNARSAAQVRPLRPKRNCFLLVTSRWSLEGFEQTKLEVLSPGDAVTLLRSVAPKLSHESDAALQSLATLCGNLPLALRAVGCTLQKRVNLTLSGYLERLQATGRNLILDETDPELNRSTAGALQSSYDLLDEELQRCFRLLGAFPGTFDLMAAQAVWDASPEFTESGLEELLSYGLIENKPRWRLHDLVRAFAQKRMSDTERNAAQRRQAHYYLEFLEDVQRLCGEAGRPRADAARRLSDEWLNIQTGQAWTARNIGNDLSAAYWCWRYAHDAARCLSANLYGAECIRWREDALAAAQKLGKIDWQAAALTTLGWAYKDSGHYSRAIECHKRHLDMAIAQGRQDWKCEALFALALAHQAIGDYDCAIDLLQQRLALAIELQHRRPQSSAYGALGNIYCEQGQYELARDCHLQRLNIDRELGTPASHALWGLGWALLKLGDYETAKKHLEESLAISRTINDVVAEHTAHGLLGDVYHAQESYELARDHHALRAEIARNIGDVLGEAQGNFGKARAQYRMARSAEDLDRAIALGRSSLKAMEAIHSIESAKVREELQKWTAARGTA